MQQPVQIAMFMCTSAQYSQLQNKTAELRPRFSLQNNLKFLRHRTQLGSGEYLQQRESTSVRTAGGVGSTYSRGSGEYLQQGSEEYLCADSRGSGEYLQQGQ